MKPVALLIATVSALLVSGLQAQFPVSPSADLVLGQANFTSNTLGGASQSSMDAPSGVAVDPVTGKVFVSQSGQNRILRYASGAALVNGANAEAVIGQSNYTSADFGVTATRLSSPYGLDIDAAGRLWVADYSNNRVLMFEDAATLPEFDASADLVLGQADFTSNANVTNQVGMAGPTGVHVDAAGNLWVADFDGNRVVMFADAASLGDGAPAALVLGQPDFNTAIAGTSDVKMTSPSAVAVDTAGRLFVAEQANNRLLRFDAAATLASGAAANAVLGQSDFTTDTAGSAAGELSTPGALAFDRKGTLYIADFDNNRVVYHKNPATKSNKAIPDGVIGQPDLTTVAAGVTAQVLGGPYGGLDFDAAGNLWVTDYDNHRALRFPGDFTAAAPTVRGKVPKTTTRATLTLRGTATDPNGVAGVKYRVGTKGAFRTAVGTTSWRFTARLKPGRNTIEIIATDSYGNTSAAKRVSVKRL
jgi:DNA-binding beta-propeller fold protein YncE